LLVRDAFQLPNYQISQLLNRFRSSDIEDAPLICNVRHTTTFLYEPAVRESVMEVRLQPRSDGDQRCLSFTLDVEPMANVMQYQDFIGNTVHHFDIAGTHSQVKVTAQSAVEVQSAPLPRPSNSGDWSDLDALIASGDYWEMLLPSHFAHSSPILDELAKELKCERRDSPLALLTELNAAIYQLFAYVPNSTKVDSPIEEALAARQGVCQDFAHIMIALVRPLKIPCRYVSGYMFHRDEEEKDRSLEGASHAWVEALVPRSGWVAFDPTNNLVGADRHIRVAIGRDYADVPPTRGVYKGEAQSELSVAVTVRPADKTPSEAADPVFIVRSRPPLLRTPVLRTDQEQQQQQ
jgi:transglutaminase-like putative cysteine protease